MWQLIVFKYIQMGAHVIEGYLKKKKNSKAIFSFSSFVLRYFVLDLSEAQFRIASGPKKKFKIVQFRDIISVEIVSEEKDQKYDNDYQYPF